MDNNIKLAQADLNDMNNKFKVIKEVDEDIEEDLSLEEIEALRDEDYLEFSDFVDAEHEDDLDFVEDGDK